MPQLNIVNRQWEESDISADDWVKVVESDPEFVRDPEHPLYAYWAGWPHRDPTLPPVGNTLMFHFSDGEISCKQTDASVTRKACEVAAQLGGFVVGGDDERYNLDGSISVIGDDWNRVEDKRWRWDDPEYWREPTPEEIAAIEIEDVTHLFVPVWRQRLNIFLYQLRKRWWK